MGAKQTYQQTQEEEAATWLIEDPVIRRDKVIREVIRYPLLAKQMGLNALDTSWMTVYDVGAGPLLGVSSVLHCKEAKRFDPLKEEYGTYFDISSYEDTQAEDVDYGGADLTIVTNAMDHFEDPDKFLDRLVKTMKPGAFFAHFHAINNAISHPHPAHVHNVNPELLHKALYNDYECCWYMDHLHDGLTYGWLRQPAFSGLYRKTTGYK